MTVTEAGACGTPAVASRISGHRDAVIDDRSGLLFDDPEGMGDALDAVISDEILRKRLGIGAFEHAVAVLLGRRRPRGVGRAGLRGVGPALGRRVGRVAG